MYVPIKKKTKNCGISAKPAENSGVKKKRTRRKKTEKQKLMDELDDLWRKRVREIWRGKCAITATAGVDAHHFFGKKACPATRWDTDNGILLAKGYHRFTVHKEGVTEPARSAIVQRIGTARFNELYQKAFSTSKCTLEGLEAIRNHLLTDTTLASECIGKRLGVWRDT